MVLKQPWPEVDASALVEDEVTVVIQINGKVRERMTLPAGLSEDELVKKVFEDDKVRKRIEGLQVLKTIVVPDKLVNLVVKG